MNLLRLFTAAMMSLSMVGCCCSRCVVSDPCDPCGSMPSNGCCISKLWKSSLFHRGYNWDCQCGCSCGGCGCGEMMDPYSYVDAPGCGGSCAAPVMSGVPASPGCNCGQSQPYSSLAPMVSPSYVNPVPMNSQPAYTPQPIPEVPPSTQNYAPAPPASSSPDPQSTMAPAMNGQPQMVSYEEFQRLPGKMISGPEATNSIAIPAPVQQVSTTSSFVVPPAPTPSAPRGPSRFVRPGPNQQAVWTPSRPN